MPGVGSRVFKLFLSLINNIGDVLFNNRVDVEEFLKVSDFYNLFDFQISSHIQSFVLPTSSINF